MPLIVTPGQLVHRSELYQQLAQLTAAGLGLVRSLDQLQRNPPSRSYREPLRRILDEIAQGRTFTQAAANTGGWLPELDLALLQAGETSGKLDACFRTLADYYAERARMARQMISQLIYPVGLIHFAVFVFMIVLPFAAAGMNFNGTLVWLFVRAALALSPLYLGTALLIYALQSKHGETWRATIETLLHYVPMLGKARHYLALARLCTALEALISSGVNIIEAWTLATSASGSPALRRIVAGWQPQFAARRTPAEILRATPHFPDTFTNLYATGEVSGKLDEALGSLRRFYSEEGTRKLQTLASLMPKAIYLVVMLAIAWFVIKFYLGYFSQLNQVMDGK